MSSWLLVFTPAWPWPLMGLGGMNQSGTSVSQMKKKKNYVMYLKGRERTTKRGTSQPYPKCPQWPEPGARNSGVSCGWQGPACWSRHLPPPRVQVSRKLESGVAQDSKPGALVWDGVSQVVPELLAQNTHSQIDINSFKMLMKLNVFKATVSHVACASGACLCATPNLSLLGSPR